MGENLRRSLIDVKSSAATDAEQSDQVAVILLVVPEEDRMDRDVYTFISSVDPLSEVGAASCVNVRKTPCPNSGSSD